MLCIFRGPGTHIDKLKTPAFNSWKDFNCALVGRDPPKLFNFFVAHCNTTSRPIFSTMKRAEPTATIRKPVNHNVATSREPPRCGPRSVFRGRIGDVEREMKIALWIAIIDLVDAFRGFLVAFLLFRTGRIAT